MSKSHPIRHRSRKRCALSRGFSLPETIIALLTGTLLITGSGFALRTMSSAIKDSGAKANSRQNAINGLKLLRSEVERSMHILVYGQTPENLPHTNLAAHKLEVGGIALTPDDGIVTYCENLATEKNIAFKPVFGVKMAELANPILYGLSLSSNNMSATATGYSLMRCGVPLNELGKYETSSSGIYISMILDNIATLPCLKEGQNCNEPTVIDKETKEKRVKTKLEILEDIDLNFSILPDAENEPDSYTPYRKYLEPAIRFKTDISRKVLKFDDPSESIKNTSSPNVIEYDPENLIDMTYITTGKGTQKVYLTAFARADKRLVRQTINGLWLDGMYFNGYIDNTVRFVVDASGSMDNCAWKGKFNRCNKTRMESVKRELVQLLTSLKKIAPNTKVGVTFFSHREGRNHKSWFFDHDNDGSDEQLVPIGANGALDSLESMVRSITPDGFTEPWDGMDAAFADHTTTTLFLLSDGEPKFNAINQSNPESRRSIYPQLFATWDGSEQSKCRERWWVNSDPSDLSYKKWNTHWNNKWHGKKCWTNTQTSYNDWDRIANWYISKNELRPSNQKMKVNTISIDLDSAWMRKLSTETGGKHNHVDTQKIIRNNGHGNNSDSCDSSNPSATFSHCTQDDENKP